MAIGVDPCPFCGSPASVTEIFTGSGAYVECDNCDAAGPEAKKREDAVRLWNTRHVITPVKSESADCQLGTQLRGADLMAALAATEYHRSQVQTFTYGAGRETRNVVRDLTKPQGEQEVARFVGEHTATHEQAIQAAEEYRLDLVAAALAK